MDMSNTTLSETPDTVCDSFMWYVQDRHVHRQDGGAPRDWGARLTDGVSFLGWSVPELNTGARHCRCVRCHGIVHFKGVN